MNAPLTLSDAQQQDWMKRLLRRAQAIGEQGEVPVSAVVLDAHGRCIGFGGNTREQDQDPLGHAELVALRQATRLRGDWRLNDCTLLVTLEPCPMCAGALVQARMGQVIYAANDPKRGAMGSTINLSTHISAHHHMQVIGGVLGKEASAMLAQWFRRRRRRADGTSATRFRTD
ncbi:MAG: nucleoside deaminase [Synechococcus sp.]